MADKRIDQLTAATSLTAVDLMVTEQSGVAKKVTGDILANSAWNMMQKDASPTKDSTAPVTSGAVYDALGGVFSPTKLATPGALVHIEDGAYNQPVQGMKIAISPVQNLHGYDNPWPGGGKNLIPLTVERIKAANTTGTWSDNAYTYRGVTFTLLTDDGGNVTGVRVTGTNTSTSGATLGFSGIDVPVGTYYFNGIPDGLRGTTEYLGINVAGTTQYVRSNTSGKQVTVTATEEHHTGGAWIAVSAGSTASGLVYLPMLRKSDVSDSTFAPFSNICPISGRDAMSLVRTGSNLISPFDGYATQTDKGITTTFDGENVSVVGTSTGGNTNSTNMPLASPLKLFAGKTYIFAINGNFATPNLRLRLRNESGDLWYGDSNNCIWTVTPTTDLTITRVGFRVIASGSTIDVSGAFYCNLGSLGAYEPYKGTTYEVSFGAAGTVYGGTLTYNGDGTWTLIVDHYTMTVTGDDITTTVNLGDVLRTNLVYVEIGKNTTGRNAIAISNWLPRIAANYSGNAMGFYFDSNTRIYIKVPNNAVGVTSETSGEDRLALTKAFFDANPLFVVYPLATALSFTLTGPEVLTLLGQNSFWADTGDIEELAYRADIGLYLTEALNPIKEMLAYREDTMRATRAYTTGDFIVVGDTFYKAATAIANGATLTPGTNVNATTVGAQLKLLS